MSGAVHISSLVVQVRPERAEAVRQIILDRGGDVPAADPCGKLVALIETDSEDAVTRFANDLSLLDGVLSANLVFHAIDAPDRDSAPQSSGDAG